MARDSGRGLGPQGKDAINRYSKISDNSPGAPRYTVPSDKLNTTKVGIRSLFPSGGDFDPFILGLAPTYFQGPTSSTRVRAHQFVPVDSDINDVLNSGNEDEIRALSKQFDASIRGYIHVKFWKRDTECRYGPCSLSEYRTFRESSSKGRSVVGLEGYGFQYCNANNAVFGDLDPSGM